MSPRLVVRLLPLLIAVLVGCGSRPPAPTAPAPAAPPAAQAWYEPELRTFEAADKANPPAPGQVLFVGSSSFRMWKTLAQDMAPAPIINRGFGGSKTGEVLALFDRLVLPYKPAVIAYYCGDNDLGLDNTDARAAAEGFIAFDRRARALWPHVRTFYVPIKASVQRWKNWPAMKQANDLVRAYCEATPGATYLDTVTPTLGPDGTPDPSLFLADGLHINDKGYAIWTRVIRGPILDAWQASRK